MRLRHRVGTVGVAAIAAAALGCAAPRSSATAPSVPGAAIAAGDPGTPPPVYDRALFLADDADVRFVRLSPDGRFVSANRRTNGVFNIWVAPAGTPLDSGRAVTASPTSLRGHDWAADGRSILFLHDSAGDQRFHLFAVDHSAPLPAGTAVPPARDLTPVPDASVRLLAVPERAPDVVLITLSTRERPVPDVYRLHLRTGARDLVFRNDHGIDSWTADLDGRLRLGRRTRPDGAWEIVAVEGDSLRPVYSCAATEQCVPERFHPDGQRVYLRTNRGDADLVRLVLLDLRTGTETVVAEDPARAVDLGLPVFSGASGRLAGASFPGGTLRWIILDTLLARDVAHVARQVPGRVVSPLASSRDDRRWLLAVSSATDRGAYYLYDRATGALTVVHRPPARIPPEHLAERRAVEYRARDGLVVPAYLTLPRGVSGRGLPTVIVVHGGPWGRSYPGFEPWAALLANRGYAVLEPQFRGSAGFGKRFLDLGNREWGGRMQDDVTDGVQWLVAQGIADSTRVAILGQSYGGYSALAGLAFTPHLYRAGVVFYGQSDLVAFMEATQPQWATAMGEFRARMADLDDPADRERLVRRSPLTAAAQIRAPVLLAHGENDPLVPKAQSDRMVARLRELGRDVGDLVVPGEGHGFGQTVNQLAVWAAVERFLARHLGGRFQAEMSPEVERRLDALRAGASAPAGAGGPRR